MKCVCVLVHMCVCSDVGVSAGVKRQVSLEGALNVEYGHSVIVCVCIKRGVKWNSCKKGFFSLLFQQLHSGLL